MKRLTNAGMIKRDLSFPIVFQGETITASPGDTLGSAILLNDKENLVPTYFFSEVNTSDLAHEDEGSYLGMKKDALLYLDPFFQKEVYPGFKFNFGKLDPVRGQGIIGSRGLQNATASINQTDLRKYPLDWFPQQFLNLMYRKFIPSSFGTSSELGRFVDTEFLSTEVLIVGAGIAGLVAALACSRAGLKVLIIEKDFILGGRLNSEGESNNSWLINSIDELRNRKNVRVLTRTNLLKKGIRGNFLAIQRSFQKDNIENISPIYRHITIKAENTYIATGSRERLPPSFINQKLPGIMSSGFLNTLLNRFGLGANHGVTLYVNNDLAWSTVKHLMRLGLSVDAIVDARSNGMMVADCPVFRGAKVVQTEGRSRLTAVIIRTLKGRYVKIKTSFLAVSWGYNANFDIISSELSKLEWCPEISSFRAIPRSCNLTLVGGAHSVFCPKKSAEDSFQAASEFIKTSGAKAVNVELPTLEPKNYDCQLSENSILRPDQDWKNRLFGIGLFASSLSTKTKKPANKNSQLEILKNEALERLFNDRNEIKIIQKNSKGEPRDFCYSRIIFVNPSLPGPLKKTGTKILQPFRVLPYHFEYEKFGASWLQDGEWLVPALFFKNKNSNDKKELIDEELKATLLNAGLSDMSDFEKVKVTGKDANQFLKNALGFSPDNLSLNECQEGMLLQPNGMPVGQMILLMLGPGNYILIKSNQSNNSLFTQLISKKNCNKNYNQVNIRLVTEEHQYYNIWGEQAIESLSNALDLGQSLFKLKSFKIKIIKKNHMEYAIWCDKISVIPSCKVLVFSDGDSTFFSKIFSSIKLFNGALIGRLSTDIIELENGRITVNENKVKHGTQALNLKSMAPFSNSLEKTNSWLKFDPHYMGQKLSKFAFILPKGLTRNIVVGSEVKCIDDDSLKTVLGHVLLSYYSRVQKSFVGFVLLKRATTFNKLPVIVMNLNKNYNTTCNLSSLSFYGRNNIKCN